MCATLSIRMALMGTDKTCPCGSERSFANCCEPTIQGAAAETPEALMRSRYSAYVLGYWNYLRESWHPKTRPSRVSPTDTDWLGLTIVKTTANSVEFIAGFREGSKVMLLHETSRFELVDGHWCYLDGRCDITEAGRNSSCPCGSGVKTKRCCGKG